LTGDHLSPSPLADPARYPGERPAVDYLLIGTEIRPLRIGADGWQIAVSAKGGRAGRLHDLLGGPLHTRQPVVAFGSNAAPAQLVAKFGSVDTGIPVTRARLQGFVIGHSPHVSTAGYLPWVLVDAPGAVVDCAVLWLDRRQRARLDVTEPNYDLVTADPVRYPLQVPAVDASIAYSAYRGKWGALRWPGEDRPARAATQAEVFARLGTFGWFRGLVGVGGLAACQRRLAADAGLRDRIRHELADRGMAVADGWTA
jgi:hypothetical protein